MKKYKRMICACLAAVELFLFVSCSKGGKTLRAGDFCRIGGEYLYFLANEELDDLREPLIKLLANRKEMYYQDGADVQFIPPDPDSPSIAYGYRCGLFDFTGDGIPELAVEPHGYSGSSGATEYWIYDIYTGDQIAEIHTGEGSICLYYSIKHDSVAIINAYTTQCGYSEPSKATVSEVFDFASGEFVEDFRMNESSLMHHENGMDSPLVTEIRYSVNGETVDWHGYHSQVEHFIANYIRIPETELRLIDWSDVSENGAGRFVRAEKMADALIGSAQKYIIPINDSVKD